MHAQNAEAVPKGLRVTPLTVGDRQLVAMSYPIGSEESSTDVTGLTPVEHEIVRALLDGLSNAEIATQRSRSIFTINKQIESVYRKLRVGSRCELFARLAR